jgi:hypothetical protein
LLARQCLCHNYHTPHPCHPGGLLFCIEEGVSFYSTSIFWRGFLATCVGVRRLQALCSPTHPAVHAVSRSMLHSLRLSLPPRFTLADGFCHLIFVPALQVLALHILSP